MLVDSQVVAGARCERHILSCDLLICAQVDVVEAAWLRRLVALLIRVRRRCHLGLFDFYTLTRKFNKATLITNDLPLSHRVNCLAFAWLKAAARFFVAETPLSVS